MIDCVIAVIQLADRVIDLFSTFIDHVKEMEKEIIRVITMIIEFKIMLKFLQNIIENDVNDN